MILANKENGKLKLEGTRSQLLAELSVVIEELIKDINVDEVMFAVKLGFCGGDTLKMLDLAKNEVEKIRRNKKKWEEY